MKNTDTNRLYSLLFLRFPHLLFVFFFASLILFSSSSASARDIRVLILDEEQKSAPDLKEMKKVGNMTGKLLFKGNEYNGKIEVFKANAGLFVVNEVPIEEYVKSVVKAEVGDNWPMEALKAQAVAVRTYAIYNILHSKNDVYDLTSTSLSQIYKGKQSDPNVEKAVNATRGEIITHKNKPINALYHSTSGGQTELPEEIFGKSYPYLTSVKTECTSSPYYIWERRIMNKELAATLSLDSIDNITISKKTKTGRVKELKIASNDKEIIIDAKTFRKTLGWKKLPSTWFSVSKKEKLFIFNGKGYGHGVGMCQWSAMEMAKKGESYKKILSLFYPDTTIQLYED